MIEVFKSGLYDYPDQKKNFEKPVKYTEEMLKDIASSIGSIPLTKGHTDEVIGSLTNFTYHDGGLFADEPKGLDLDGLGVSPTFEVDYVETEDCMIPVKWDLLSVGVVSNPRKPIKLENSNGDVNMSDDKLLDSLNKANEELAKERELNRQLESKIEEFEKTSAKYVEEQKKIEKQIKQFEKLQEEFEIIKPQAEKYQAYQEHRKAELIKKFNPSGDEQIQNYLEKKPLEDLEFEANNGLLNTKPNGASTGSPGEQTGEQQEGRNPNEPQEGSPEEFYKNFEEFEKQSTIW